MHLLASERDTPVKTFSCGAVVPGCTADFTAASEEEILAEVAAHARRDHGLTELSERLVADVRANIRPAA